MAGETLRSMEPSRTSRLPGALTAPASVREVKVAPPRGGPLALPAKAAPAYVLTVQLEAAGV